MAAGQPPHPLVVVLLLCALMAVGAALPARQPQARIVGGCPPAPVDCKCAAPLHTVTYDDTHGCTVCRCSRVSQAVLEAAEPADEGAIGVGPSCAPFSLCGCSSSEERHLKTDRQGCLRCSCRPITAAPPPRTRRVSSNFRPCPPPKCDCGPTEMLLIFSDSASCGRCKCREMSA